MSVKLRLRRMGTRNKPSYRIVATDSRNKRDGRFIEILGFYDPRRNMERVDLERADYWLGVGAQPSQTVSGIIHRAKQGRPLTPPVKEKPAPTPLIEQPKPDAEKPAAPAEAPAEEAAEAPEKAEAEAPEKAEAEAPEKAEADDSQPADEEAAKA